MGLTSDNVKQITRRVAGIMRTATMSNDLGVISFDGGDALNDMTIGLEAYTGLFPKKYQIAISDTGTPDKFRYTDNGGVTWSVEASITGSAQSLSNGINITFGSTTGHTLGTTWTFITSPSYGAERLRDFMETVSDIEVLNDMVPSVYSAAKAPNLVYAKYKTDAKAIITALVAGLDSATLDAYLNSQSLMVNCDFVQHSLATLNAARVIPPQTVLGTFEFTGSGTGTYTEENTIDTTLYNGGLIELYALSDITDAGSDGVVSVGGTSFDGSSISASVAVAFGGTVNQYSTIDLSTAYPQRFKAVTSIAVSGGASGQKFQIRTQEDWKPIL